MQGRRKPFPRNNGTHRVRGVAGEARQVLLKRRSETCAEFVPGQVQELAELEYAHVGEPLDIPRLDLGSRAFERRGAQRVEAVVGVDDVGNPGAGERHRRRRRARGGDARRVSQPSQQRVEVGGERFGAAEKSQARARIENQAIRRRHADAGGVSVCGLRQKAQTPALFGDIAVEVLEVGDDAAGGGERRTGRDAGGARRDVHERDPLAVHEHRSSAALVRLLGVSTFEDLKAEMRQVDAVPERGPPLSLRGRRRRERRCYFFASFALFASFAPFARQSGGGLSHAFPGGTG